MARLEPFDRIAKRLIHDTPFRNAEFYRVIPSTGIGEYVRIADGVVVEYTREPHDPPESAKRRQRDTLRKSSNDLELRGIVSMNGTPIEYYGTEKGWQKFKEEWNMAL